MFLYHLSIPFYMKTLFMSLLFCCLFIFSFSYTNRLFVFQVYLGFDKILLFLITFIILLGIHWPLGYSYKMGRFNGLKTFILPSSINTGFLYKYKRIKLLSKWVIQPISWCNDGKICLISPWWVSDIKFLRLIHSTFCQN